MDQNFLKKKTELKAVPTESGETGHAVSMKAYQPNEELIQSTSRIKAQRALTLSRLQKMEINKDRVTKNVFEKVFRDYRMQLESITKMFNEKKVLIARELKTLYMLREGQTVEINRHKEILEEARFRHFLEEFSEEQYKEVEEFESREILSLQEELAQINAYLKLYEELFNENSPPPADPAKAPVLPTAQPEKAEEVSFTLPPPAPVVEAKEEVKIIEAQPVEVSKVEVLPTKPADDFSDTTPPVQKNQTEVSHAEPPTVVSLKVEDTLPPQASVPPLETPQEALPAAPKQESDSILDILEGLSLDSDNPEPISQVITNHQPVDPPSLTENQKSGYKLVITECEEPLDIKELPLKENTSIGRSPSNDLVLKASKSSRQHAAINKYKDQYILIDLKSSNGVYVNNRKIDEHTLEEGDEISIGGYKMIFTKA